MPGQICDQEGRLAASRVGEEQGGEGVVERATRAAGDCIEEEEGCGELSGPRSTVPPAGHYSWRVDLAASEPHWSGWFQGLSNRFLEARAAKLLLLAGVDRLDKDLTVGQMQGKFQMQVLPAVGHTVHEDSPDKVAEVLATFLVRNKLCKATEAFQPALGSPFGAAAWGSCAAPPAVSGPAPTDMGPVCKMGLMGPPPPPI